MSISIKASKWRTSKSKRVGEPWVGGSVRGKLLEQQGEREGREEKKKKDSLGWHLSKFPLTTTVYAGQN